MTAYAPSRPTVMAWLLILALATSAPRLPAQAPQTEGLADLLIRNARVFDGLAWRARATIVVSGSRIRDLTDEAPSIRAKREVDGTGLTVIPGLIDAHVHVLDYRSPTTVTPTVLEQLRRLLHAGVTTIQSTGDFTSDIVALRARIAAGSIAAPRLFVTGPNFTAPGGHPATTVCRSDPSCRAKLAVEVATEAEVRRAVAELAGAGVDAVKLVVDPYLGERPLDMRLVRTVVDAAHARGLRVLGHIVQLDDARTAVALGLDALVHLVHGRTPSISEDSLSAAFAGRPVPVATTVSIFAPFLARDGSLTDGFGRDYARAVLRFRWPGAGSGDSAEPARDRFQRLESMLRSARVLHRAGVPLAAGTDQQLASASVVTAERRYLRELQLLVEAGLSTTEVLRAATRNAALLIGARDLGGVAPGMVADLVVLGADPSENLLELQSVQMVIKAGEVVLERHAR
jgi:imidazolonepropionase-like amidohydrolase